MSTGLGKSDLLTVSILAVILLLTAVIYYPGLNSRFLLDDFYNLKDLGLVAEKGYASFVSASGFAGPSGRPISLYSFALQHESWPDNPSAFKKINLLIHLINGILVFAVCKFLATLLFQRTSQQTYFCLIAVTLWLLHPIQLSTTLYVTQRMTQLSALFVLLGVLGFLYYRMKLNSGGSILSGGVILLMTGLAVLSKENGILLPIFILSIELTILAGVRRPDRWKAWIWAFLFTPLLLLSIYLAFRFEGNLLSYESRNFNLQQRLLTEAVVLFDYLKIIFLPSPSAFTLYHDDFPVASGLFSSPQALLAIAGLIALSMVAIKFRKTLPVISFAICWFFGGHLLESSFLNLELYFEHRNYLPAFGIFVLIAWFAVYACDRMGKKYFITIPAGTYCLLVILITIIEVDMWSKPALQAAEWARIHPTSFRAQNDLAALHVMAGNYNEAMVILERIEDLQPGDIYPSLQKINISSCRKKETIPVADWNKYIDIAENGRAYGLSVIAALDLLVLSIANNTCKNIDKDKLSELIGALQRNTSYHRNRKYLDEFSATLLKLRTK